MGISGIGVATAVDAGSAGLTALPGISPSDTENEDEDEDGYHEDEAADGNGQCKVSLIET